MPFLAEFLTKTMCDLGRRWKGAALFSGSGGRGARIRNRDERWHGHAVLDIGYIYHFYFVKLK